MNLQLAEIALGIIPVLLSLTIHEFAHAWAAKQLGDDTAERAGRLTLNPVPHIDPFGTLLLPALLALSGMPRFGWAKPVPVNPSRYTRKVSMRTGDLLVSAAGPLSNLVLAISCAGALSILVHTGAVTDPASPWSKLLLAMTGTNIALFVFNMIPVGPLDGQKVLTGLLPHAASQEFQRFSQRFGWISLVLVVVFAGRILAWPVQFIWNGLAVMVGLG